MLIGTYDYVFLYGALFGTPAGGLLGLILGIVEGIMMACIAGYMVRKGATVPIIARKIRRTTPIATMILVSGTIFMSGTPVYTVERMLDHWTELAVYAIIVLASWHAALIVTGKFMDEYE